MNKKSKLTELYIEAVNAREKFGISNDNYLLASKFMADIENEIFTIATPYMQDKFIAYMDACDTVSKYQITDAIRRGYKTGILEADAKLKIDKNAFISTNELMFLLSNLRDEKTITTQDIISAIEKFIDPSTGFSKN